MRTTKKVVIELDAGETIEVVARFQRDGKHVEAKATIEHDVDLDHPQLRLDVTGSGQANVLTRGHRDMGLEQDVEIDEVFFNQGISIFL